MSLLTLLCRQYVDRTIPIGAVKVGIPSFSRLTSTQRAISNSCTFITMCNTRYFSLCHLRAVSPFAPRLNYLHRDSFASYSSLPSSAAKESKDAVPVNEGTKFFAVSTESTTSSEKENIVLDNSSTSISSNSSSAVKESSSPISAEEPPPSSPAASSSSSPPSRAARLRRAVAEYGVVVPIFHISLALTSLGFFYVLVSAGVDFDGVFAFFGVQENKFVSGVSTFAFAYGAHKLFAPVRIGITLSVAPLLVKWMRRNITPVVVRWVGAVKKLVLKR